MTLSQETMAGLRAELLSRGKLRTSKPAKYRNVKAMVDGIKFDSQAEAKRYAELRIMEKSGCISDLKCQVPFVLAPAVVIQGRKRPALRYVSDFCYIKDRQRVVEDVKGIITEGYRIKRHLMAVLGIEIIEIRRGK